MNEMISVIIPFWKVPGIQLRYCINSFLKQSYTNFELILVDDGNELDIYKNLLQEYQSLDDRIKVIHQKKAGVSVARNNAINQAVGSYIVFCDSDDFVESNFLEEMHKNILDNDLVICSIAEQFFPVINSRIDLQYFVSKPSQYNYPQYVNFSVNKIYKKELLDKFNIRFDPAMQMGEDALFVASYIQKCSYIKCLNSSLYHYRWNDFSAMHRYNDMFWENEERVINSQYNLFHLYNLSMQEEMFMTRWMYIKFKDIFYYYLRNEKEVDKIESKFNAIFKNAHILNLLNGKQKNNICLNFYDKIILLLWSKMRAEGPFVMSYLSRIKRFLKGELSS